MHVLNRKRRIGKEVENAKMEDSGNDDRGLVVEIVEVLLLILGVA